MKGRRVRPGPRRGPDADGCPPTVADADVASRAAKKWKEVQPSASPGDARACVTAAGSIEQHRHPATPAGAARRRTSFAWCRRRRPSSHPEGEGGGIGPPAPRGLRPSARIAQLEDHRRGAAASLWPTLQQHGGDGQQTRNAAARTRAGKRPRRQTTAPARFPISSF